MGKRKHKGPPQEAKKQYLGPPSDAVIQLGDLVFSKYYTFPDDAGLNLDTLHTSLFTAPLWADTQLQDLKLKLNELKSQLSEIDINEWHQHTSRTHPGGMVINSMRKKNNPEMCTQAWAKFREIIHRVKLDKSESSRMSRLRSVHLCEAPGAFITSLNHYIKNTGITTDWNWVGTTLNPYYEGTHQDWMIDNDELIYSTQSHWYYGVDDTGNLRNMGNINGLVTRGRDLGDVQLVTADGGFDCSDNPGEQESLSASLHYSELVAALHILAPGGTFVLKMFTLYESSSISLLYLLRSCFNKLTLFKPVTSKPGNSEVYLLCESYKNVPKSLLKCLLEQVGDYLPAEQAILPETDIPESFRDLHRKCCERFTRYQSDAISQNLNIRAQGESRSSSTLHEVESLRLYCLQEFERRYKVKPIDYMDWIVPPVQENEAAKKYVSMRPNKRLAQGSFVTRQKKLHMAWIDRVKYMDLVPRDSNKPLPWINHLSVTESEVSSWQPVRGKGFAGTLSSRFCDNKLLNIYNDLLQHGQVECSAADVSEFHVENSSAILKVVEDILYTHMVAGVPEGNTLSKILLEREVLNQPHKPDKERVLYAVDGFNNDVDEKWWCTARHSLCTLVHCLCAEIQELDSLVLTIPPLLTRLAAAMVYICQRAFKKVTIVIPDEATQPVCYLVAVGYRMLPTAMTFYLGAVNCILGNDVSVGSCHLQEENQLLGLVPIQSLYEKDVQDLIWPATARMLQRRVNYILKGEKMRLINLAPPPEIQQEKSSPPKKPKFVPPVIADLPNLAQIPNVTKSDETTPKEETAEDEQMDVDSVDALIENVNKELDESVEIVTVEKSELAKKVEKPTDSEEKTEEKEESRIGKDDDKKKPIESEKKITHPAPEKQESEARNVAVVPVKSYVPQNEQYTNIEEMLKARLGDAYDEYAKSPDSDVIVLSDSDDDIVITETEVRPPTDRAVPEERVEHEDYEKAPKFDTEDERTEQLDGEEQLVDNSGPSIFEDPKSIFDP